VHQALESARISAWISQRDRTAAEQQQLRGLPDLTVDQQKGGWGEAAVSLDVRLKVHDPSGAAGVNIDLIRIAAGCHHPAARARLARGPLFLAGAAATVICSTEPETFCFTTADASGAVNSGRSFAALGVKVAVVQVGDAEGQV